MKSNLPSATSGTWLGALLLLVGVFSTSCASHSMAALAGERFIGEYNCPDVLVKKLSPDIVRVRGCGIVATYICGNRCFKESAYAAAAAEEVQAQSAKASERRTTRTARPDKNTFQAIFRRGSGLLTISARPLEAPDEVRFKMQLPGSCENCEAKLAIDGVLVALLHVPSTSPKIVEATFNANALTQLAASHRATFRVGDLDWEVSEDDKLTLSELIANSRQEQALSGVVQSSGSEAPNESL